MKGPSIREGGPRSPTSPDGRLKSDGSTFLGSIDALNELSLSLRGSREAIVGKMRELCKVRHEQKKFEATLEEEVRQLEQGGENHQSALGACKTTTRDEY